MYRFGSISLFCALIVVLSACGGSSSSSLPETTQPHATAVADGLSGLEPTEMVAGEDYLPNRIWTGLREEIDEKLIPLLPADVKSSFAKETAEMQEAMLYRALADTVAAHYGAQVKFMSVLPNAKWASFEFSGDAECAAALSSIELDFADYLSGAAYVPICTPTAWGPPNDPDYTSSSSSNGVLWDMKKINCQDAWDLTRGDPDLRIAVVDSGVRHTHEELITNVIDPAQLASEFTPAMRSLGYTLDLFDGDDTPNDPDGHGTACAGMIGAEGNNGQTMIGVAFDCSIVPVKINDGSTFGADAGYAGIDIAFRLGSKVISCSWGHGGTAAPWEQFAINQLHNNDVLLVGAAGNDNTNAAHYPSDLNHVLGVGATDRSDNRSSFSNYGPGVDVAAPGQEYISAAPWSDNSYDPFGGTSGACPLVAGGAALLFSAKPSLTPDDVIFWLESTGDPVLGFADGVKRVNLGTALTEGVGVIIEAALPDQLIYSGMAQFTPSVIGTPDRIDAKVDGNLVGSTSSAPWVINADLSGIARGLHALDVIGVVGPVESHSVVTIYVDNTQGDFPMVEGFESTPPDFFGLEVKGYSKVVGASLKDQPSSEWSTAQLDGNGIQVWNTSTEEPYKGSKLSQFGDGGTYGNWELDALISPRYDLTGIDTPTVTFQQHYNIADAANTWDAGRVLVTTNGGRTFTAAELKEGGPARFNGYLPFWTKSEINLSAYVGQSVHLVFLFESDGVGIGAQAGEPAGWWIDSVVVSSFYNDGKASLGTPALAPGPAFGKIPTNWSLTASTPQGMLLASVTYKLILPDSSELVETATEAPYVVSFNLPETLIGNHVLNMQITTTADAGGLGPGIAKPVYIFNQLGDTNADGLINQADQAGYEAMLGLTPEDEDYIPFFDSNLDGLITEADAAAVGYHWSE